jgi:hypothetical protein
MACPAMGELAPARLAYVSSLNLQDYYTAALGNLSSDFNEGAASPYAGDSQPGDLEGCKPAKNHSFLHQARATPAPGGETKIFGETLPSQTPLNRSIPAINGLSRKAAL